MGYKISVSQVFYIFLLSTGLSNHVLVIPLLIDAAGRDAWISVLIGYLISIPFLLILLYVMKNLKNISLFDWLKSTYSAAFSRIIATLIAIYLLIVGWITLKETVTWTHETYLLNTPVLVIGLSILASSIYISYGKINVIAICAGVLLPLVIVLGCFVAIGTIPAKDYSFITPVLVENTWWDVGKGSIFVFGSLVELVLLVILQDRVSKRIKFPHLLLLSLFLIILTLGPLLGSMAVFGPEEVERLRYPAFLQWRILSIGTYFNHLDFLSIYQWLSGSFIRLALILYLITKVFEMQSKKGRIVIQSVICVLYLVFISIPISDEQLAFFLRKYFYSGSSIFAVMVLLILAIFIKKSKNRVSANEK